MAGSARLGSVAEIAWTPSTDDVGVTGYEVGRAGVRVATVLGTTFREEKLPAGKEHCFTVTALDAAGNRSSPSDPACILIPDTTPPTVPPGVTASAGEERVVDVHWGAAQESSTATSPRGRASKVAGRVGGVWSGVVAHASGAVGEQLPAASQARTR